MEYIYKIEGRRTVYEKGTSIKEILESDRGFYNHWVIEDYIEDHIEYLQSIDHDEFSILRFIDLYEFSAGAEYHDFKYTEYFNRRGYDIGSMFCPNRYDIKEMIEKETREYPKKALACFIKDFMEFLQDFDKNGFYDDASYVISDEWENGLTSQTLQHETYIFGVKITLTGWVNEWTEEEQDLEEGYICPNCEKGFTLGESEDDYLQHNDESMPSNICYCPHCGHQSFWDDINLQKINPQHPEKHWLARQI